MEENFSAGSATSGLWEDCFPWNCTDVLYTCVTNALFTRRNYKFNFLIVLEYGSATDC